MGDSGPVDVCVRGREGVRECMRRLIYSIMHTHQVYGTWVCAGVGVQIRLKCVCVRVRVYKYD